MKVGKAIYNILSQSTEVQSNFPFNTTDYSPTGTELVTNGDFSATGTELVTNGSFENNGDNWTIEEGSGTVTFPNNQAQIISTGGAAQTGIKQDILTNNKNYKVTIDVESITGTLKLLMGGNGNVTLITTTGVQTFYLQTATITNETFYLIRNIGDTVDVVLNSVSVKELGEGWAMNEAGSVAYNENGATITSINGGADEYKLYQDDVTTSGKSYKVVYTIYANGITGTNRLRYYDGASYVVADSSVGTHTLYFTRVPTVDRWYWNLTTDAGTPVTDFITISSTSIEEMAVNKIFPELAPTGIEAPYVVYSVVSNSPSDTKNANGDIDTASIEVYGFQDTYNKAVDLGVSVRAALDRKTGTYNTIEIQSTNYVNEQMDVNEARKLWAAIQDYSIRIKNL